MPKGQIDLETQVIQSVTGPIGLPGYQARYIPVATKDGKFMNARYAGFLQPALTKPRGFRDLYRGDFA